MTYKDGAFGIDVSHWEPRLDAKKLTGLEVLISRIGTQWINGDPKQWMDLTFPPNAQVAYDIANLDGTYGIPFGGYWYDDWTYWPVCQYTFGAVKNFTPETDPRIVTIRRALFAGTSMRKVNFLVVDVEQPPTKPLNLEDNWANWISTSTQSLVDNLLYMMNHGEIPQMPIGVYSRKSFIDQYCKLPNGSCPLTDWMGTYQKNLGPGKWLDWIADWRYTRADSSKIYTPISAKAETIPLDGNKPSSLSDWPDVIWQYGAEGSHMVHMAGITDDRNIPLVVDVDITIPKTDFYKLVDFTPRGEPTPEPPTPPIATVFRTIITVVADGVTNLRSEPSTSQGDKTVIGKVVKGMQFYDLIGMKQSGADVWYNIDIGVWIAGFVAGKPYTQLSTIEVVV